MKLPKSFTSSANTPSKVRGSIFMHKGGYIMELLTDYKSSIIVNMDKLNSYLQSISGEIDNKISLLEIKGYVNIPKSFNSSKQVTDFLKSNLGVALSSVSSQALSDLASQNKSVSELTDTICEIRSLLKKKSALLSHSKLYNDRIKSNKYELEFTFHKGENSERISTIPSVNTIPNPFRFCVEPDKGKKFIFLDYKSAELALLIYLSEDKDLWERYLSEDIISYVADKISCTRDKAKTLIYAYLYGSSVQSISRETGIPLKQANFLLSRFRWEFSSLDSYKESYLRESHISGKAFTKYGSTKFCDNNESFDRVSFNYHIQSSFAQWMLCGINKLINHPNSNIRFVTSVFDSILVEVPIDMEVGDVVSFIDECMESSKVLLGFLPRYEIGVSSTSWGDCMKKEK